MQQKTIPADDLTISPFQRYLIGILPGIALAVALYLIAFQSALPSTPLVWIGICFLLYFLAPILPSFYVARKMGARDEGWVTGSITGCTSALLATLGASISVLIAIVSNSLEPGRILTRPGGGLLIGLVILCAFLNFLGVLIALVGAIIGSRLGKRW